MRAIIRHLNIKALSLFTCADCGRQETGSTIRQELAVECSAEEAGDLIATALQHRHPAQYMPIGWASHYVPTGDFYTCPSCTVTSR